MKFVVWYYTSALKEVFLIWRNLNFFLIDHFSVKDLLKTILSPWHRDVIARSWRGLHPGLFLKVHAENIISRFIGGIVRFVVIFIFLILFLILQIIGGGVSLLWLGGHGIFVVFLGMLIAQFNTLIFLLFALSGMWILIGFIFFLKQKKQPYTLMPIKRLHQYQWFDRVLARIGVQKKKVDTSVFYNEKDFLDLLETHHISRESFQEALSWEMQEQIVREEKGRFWTKKYLQEIPPLARQWKYAYTVHVDRFAYDVTKASQSIINRQKVCAHAQEFEKLLITLQRPSQNCALLVSQPGSGKNALVRFFADQIRKRKLPKTFHDIRVMHLDIDQVLVHQKGNLRNIMSYLEVLFQEVAHAGNIILYIKNIHNYIGQQASANELPDISTLLGKYLPLPDFRMITTTTVEQFHSVIERNSAISKYFEAIEFAPLEDAMAVRVLLDEFSLLERKRVFFTFKSLRKIVEYSNRFNANVPLPERALDMAKETLLYWKDHSQNYFVMAEDVEKFISMKTGVPLGEIQASEQEKLLHLEDVLAQRIVGQKEAVEQVSRALRKARSGIQNQQKPIGSFLFLGPTGVGKTELAKVLAKAYFGDGAHMIRLDMSEYQSVHSLERLIGSQQLQLPGKLSSEVTDHPYGVLLLDELEKAHSGVLDIFLQILDEGYVTDAFDQKILFNNLIIIATTNAGANITKKYIQEKSENIEGVKERVIEYITENEIFRVEFLNRFDGLIFFHPLSEEEVSKVTEILLHEMGDLVKKEKNISLAIGKGVSQIVAQKGYNRMFGARSIKRFIANNVEAYIAKSIIERGVKEGETLTVTIDDMENV